MINPQHFVCPHALIKSGDKFLLTHRASSVNFAPNQWDIPGGHLISGEANIDTSLSKKVLQEVGIRIKIGKIIHLFSEIQSPTRHQFQAIYDCEYLGDEIKLDQQGHDEYRWVTVQEMLNLPIMSFVRDLAEKVLTI